MFMTPSFLRPFAHSALLILLMNAGRAAFQSPTTPYCACLKIAAAGSLLIATIVLDLEHPDMCWLAPDMPMAM